VLAGIAPYDLSGWSVSAAGDVNGDGIDDLIVGAAHAKPAGHFLGGESYVVFGRPLIQPRRVVRAAAPTLNRGFRLALSNAR